MFHYFNAITNTKGDALIGYFVKVVDTVTGNVIPLYADASSTPIISVSGLADTAEVNSDGDASFWVAGGEYHLDIYATDAATLVRRIEYVPMSSAVDVREDIADGTLAPAPIETRTALAALDIPTIAASRYLSESGREGMFVWSSSNHAAHVTADTQQGLYVAPATDATGASGAWVRKFSGPADFRWFGAVADMTANGVGTSNTAIFNAARTAMIAAGHSWLHIPQQAAAYRFSTAPSAIHDGIFLTGERHYSNPGTVGATTYVGIQVFNGTVLGFAADVPGFKLVAFTDNASNALAFEYQSSNGSAIRDLVMYSEGGTGTTGHGIESFVKTDLDNLRIIGFAGSGVKLSGDDSGTANQYGNPISSNLRNVYSQYNKLHGFHITGNNGNVIKLDDCTAQLNGGAGFLDQGFLGNTYTNCQAATNNASYGTPAGYSAGQRTQATTDYSGLATQANGSFVCIGGSATSVFSGCYAEVGNGQYPDLSSQCVVNGGILANVAWQYNIGTSGNPTINSGRGVDTPQLNFTKNQTNSAVAFDNAKIYRHADQGLVLQGAPASVGTYDVSIKNKADTLVMGVGTGGTLTSFFGEVALDFANFRLNGASAFPGLIASVGRSWVSDTNGLMMAGFGSSYDTCLANQVGTVALRVPANTTNVQAVGTITGSNLSGTNTGDQTITLTGNVTGSGTGSFATTIAAGAVTLAMQANMATASVVYRKTAGSGAPEVQTLATLKTDLGLTGTNSGDQTITLTGNVTGSGTGSFATTIPAGTVTLAMQANLAATSLIGNATGGPAAPAALTLAGGLGFSGSTLTAAGALTPTSVASTGAVTSSSASAGIGYATGAGGTAAQSTSKATTVSGTNKRCVDITLNAAALAASTTVSFTFTNTALVGTDNLIINHISVGTFGSYTFNGRAAAGSATIDVRNVSLGSLSEAIVIRVTAISGATS